jgi:regulator of nucleoside diphosphate kinase
MQNTASNFQSTASSFRDVLPPIAMTAQDRDQLRRLADAALDKFPAAEFLAQEVERADVLAKDAPPNGLVTMGAEVEFRDDATGETRRVTLVYPHEADLAAGRMSVLSPVGAALIGLSAGQTIAWQLPNGGHKSLTILRVG